MGTLCSSPEELTQKQGNAPGVINPFYFEDTLQTYAMDVRSKIVGFKGRLGFCFAEISPATKYHRKKFFGF